MNLFSAMVAIAAIIGMVAVVRYWFDARRQDGVRDQRLDALERDLTERVITDQRETLKRTIDEL